MAAKAVHAVHLVTANATNIVASGRKRAHRRSARFPVALLWQVARATQSQQPPSPYCLFKLADILRVVVAKPLQTAGCKRHRLLLHQSQGCRLKLSRATSRNAIASLQATVLAISASSSLCSPFSLPSRPVRSPFSLYISRRDSPFFLSAQSNPGPASPQSTQRQI